MNQEIVWYVSRATGLVTLVLFTASVVFGILVSGRYVAQRWPRFAVNAVHRNISLIAVVFLAVHITTSVVDPYAGIGWLDTIVPFGSVYQPFWLGLGAVAFDLAVAIVVTTLLRSRVRLRAWRLVHRTSYACWPLAWVHGIGTTPADVRLTWVLAVNVGCLLTVAAAVAWRFTRADSYPRRVS